MNSPVSEPMCYLMPSNLMGTSLEVFSWLWDIIYLVAGTSNEQKLKNHIYEQLIPFLKSLRKRLNIIYNLAYLENKVG